MNMLPEALLRPVLSRTELLTLPRPDALSPLRLAVHRNHSFELVASVLNVFLAQSGLEATLWYSAYDDSLSFADALPSADVHLLWVDCARYGAADLGEWLTERALELQTRIADPIVVCTLGALGTARTDLPNIYFHDLSHELAPLGARALDERLAPLSGTRLSNAACLEAARLLGLRWLPSCFFQPIKALALDCDNTLYAGVLGEDGPKQVSPHVDVQRHLLELKRQGVLLTLVSKNEEDDVRDLFEQRGDFLLRWEDFAARAINWAPKPENIRYLAHQLNIATDAMLFVDDNPGELLQAAQALPELRLVAATSPEATVRGLRYCPLLGKAHLTAEDSIRSGDVRANAQRQQWRATLSPAEYRRRLRIRLMVAVNPRAQARRIAELCNKANQFVFTFLRPSEQQVRHYMTSPEAVCVTCSMRDTLSDSGLIAVVLARAEENTLRVEELAVSCRALGRGVETGMLFLMLTHACAALACEAVTLSCSVGPRNAPARQWLQEHWPGMRTSVSALAQVNQLKGDLSDVEIVYPAHDKEAAA